jgi:hypothetical protein
LCHDLLRLSLCSGDLYHNSSLSGSMQTEGFYLGPFTICLYMWPAARRPLPAARGLASQLSDLSVCGRRATARSIYDLAWGLYIYIYIYLYLYLYLYLYIYISISISLYIYIYSIECNIILIRIRMIPNTIPISQTGRASIPCC